MFEKLFSPIKIKDLELRNRVILPAMGTKFSGKDRYVTKRTIDYHAARAKGGCGLNMLEVCSVHTPSAPMGFLSISEDKYMPGLKRLADAVHAAGGKAGVQLWQGSMAVMSDRKAQVLVASDRALSPRHKFSGATKEQIEEIVQCYGSAAKRAVEAGFDCIEFHCAHTYLAHSFLSGGINRRTDEYGGSLENRARFPLECIRAIRAQMPEGMPLFMRVGAKDDDLDGGLTIEETIVFGRLAKEAGVDVLDVSRGNFLTDALKYEVPPAELPIAFNIENAARIRRETGMLTIGVGRINTPEIAEKILEEDQADLVVMGRAQIADPDFCRKAQAGQLGDIDYCVGCNQGCFDGFEDEAFPHITCLRNPAVGREGECMLTPAEEPKTVLVAGGGIAGLMAAVTLKKRNHNPVLCEASGVLGGQLLLAGETPGRADMKQAVISMGEKAKKLGVDIRMNTVVTPELIAELNPHTVINATGAEPAVLEVPGNQRDFIVHSRDVLNRRADVSGAVVVIGGGMEGMSTAAYLAAKGAKVTVLEKRAGYGYDMGNIRKICVKENVRAAGIKTVAKIKITEIKDHMVIGKKNGKTVEYPCDYVVVTGVAGRDASALEEACASRQIGYYEAGDVKSSHSALNATRDAFDIALTFDSVP